MQLESAVWILSIIYISTPHHRGRPRRGIRGWEGPSPRAQPPDADLNWKHLWAAWTSPPVRCRPPRSPLRPCHWATVVCARGLAVPAGSSSDRRKEAGLFGAGDPAVLEPWNMVEKGSALTARLTSYLVLAPPREGQPAQGGTSSSRESGINRCTLLHVK